MKPDRYLLLLVAALATLFGWGVVRLFNLRFSQGDVYPPYSSLRADPLGTKALYESLDDLPDFTVRRHFKNVTKLTDDTRQTVFFFGAPVMDVAWVSEGEATELERLAATGNRLVVTMLPVVTKPQPHKKKMAERERPTDPKRKKRPGEEDEEEQLPARMLPVSLERRWGFELGYANSATNALWHSTLYFDNLDPKWRVVETRRSYPAIIERSFGKGSIVLAADSYFVSNEAMRRDRQPTLLAALLGPNRDLVFDETHLGVAEDPGVMTLARKYGLHGLFAGVILLAGLFVWKNAVSFVPPYEAETDAPAAGKDSAAGFVNLLRRSIPATRVLTVCLEEWKKSKPRRAVRNLDRLEAIVAAQEALPARQRDPVGSYRTITTVLKERKP